jgi:uncharacterized repeat protein (TIGR01451 family)
MKHIYNGSMNVRLILLSVLFLAGINTKAQNHVTIPDKSFVTFLTDNYKDCMSGDQLDTTCIAIKNVTFLNISSLKIKDITGIQYFKNLEQLLCSNDSITSLPHFQLPNLKRLLCSYNQLKSISLNYPKLEQVHCDNNKLILLPPLPSTLCSLKCDHNELTSLPDVSNVTCGLEVNDNKIACFPILPRVGWLRILGNPFSCLPNYTEYMDAQTLAYPLCMENDTVNNPSKCPQTKIITGRVYKDENKDCKDVYEAGIKNVPLKLYSKQHQLLWQAYSDLSGRYEFPAIKGDYIVTIDTAEMPFKTNCKIDSSVTVTNTDMLIDEVNFGVICKAGFDIGVQSILTQGRIFPGQTHQLNVLAGSTQLLNNLNCPLISKGEVEIMVSGPVTYIGPAVGALTPVVSGNVFNYSIANFDQQTNINTAFGLLFRTNTNAHVGELVCVEVTVTTAMGDRDPSNDKKQLCYQVVNSYDPNMKQVHPLDEVWEGFKDWFTYTVHFQNTGSAPAINIVLTDTLDSNLDLETFQVLSSSHYNHTKLKGSAIEFKFPAIYLADSTSDEKASKGFIQYRIKPKANLLSGTVIRNKASIYFDFNPPIVTNTTMNHYVKSVSVDENENKLYMHVYPNPGNGQYFIQLNGEIATAGLAIEVYNLLGSVVYTGKTAAALTSIDLIHQPNGIYFIKVTGADQSFNQRLIKQ